MSQLYSICREGLEGPVDQCLDSVCDHIQEMNLHKYLHSAQGTLQEGKLGRKEVLKRGTAFQQSPLADKLLRRQRFLFLSCLL